VHTFQFQTLQWQNLTAFVNVNRDEIELFHALSFQFCLHNPFSGTAADGQSARSSFKDPTESFWFTFTLTLNHSLTLWA
jgi:hypothetical protein